MKFIRIFTVVMIIILIAFASIGLIFPSFTYTNTLEVDAEIEEVWAAFLDAEVTKEWMSGLERIELLSGDSMRAGSKYKITMIGENGEEFIMTEEILEVSTEKRLVFRIDNDVMRVLSENIFDKSGDKTILTTTNTVQGNNYMMRCLFPIFKGVFKQRQLDEYKKFKKIVEG